MEWNKLELASLTEDLLVYQSLPDSYQNKTMLTELIRKIEDAFLKKTSKLYLKVKFINEPFEKLETVTLISD